MRWLVVYYTQTGQTRRALEEVTASLVAAGHHVVWQQIRPLDPYPMPWPQRAFWGVAPRCKRGLGCPIEPLDLPPPDEIDAILLGSQPWFLAPSPPTMGFLNGPQGEIMRDKLIFPVITCRAAWRQAYRMLRTAILAHGGKIGGRLVLKDRAPTPLNIVTTVHRLWFGSEIRERPLGRIFPRFGISDRGWRRARRFGERALQVGAKKHQQST